jgi:hypothetical protein
LNFNDEYFDNIEDVLQHDEELEHVDMSKPSSDWSHRIEIYYDDFQPIAEGDTVPEISHLVERYLRMCPMIRRSSRVEYNNNAQHEGIMFLIDGAFITPARAMTFLNGLCKVMLKRRVDVKQLIIYSSVDDYGLLSNIWAKNAEMTSNIDSIIALCEHEFSTRADAQNDFPLIYSLMRVLCPKPELYSYLHELSGGYMATSELYDEIVNGFSKKFGSTSNVFNLSGSLSRDVNLKTVKYIDPGSNDAKLIRIMAKQVGEDYTDSPLFFDYSLGAFEPEQVAMPLKEELARAVRADIRSGKMTVLKSRFVQPMIGLYVVLSIGVVWCESEHRHYYIMMQIKCD